MPAASAFSAILGIRRVSYHGRKADQGLPAKRRSSGARHGVSSHDGSVARENVGGRTATPGVFLSAASCIGGNALRQLIGHHATLCAAFFLYDPLYSFYVTSPLDVGELICFVGLALIGAKCAADLLQPRLSLPQQKTPAEE
jgi:hypothetical protein